MRVLNWLTANPSAAASIVSAIIAASVAMLVFTITQFLTRRRDRTQFLMPKLEELYLLLNKVAEDNVKFFRLIYLAIEGDEEAIREISTTEELDLYGDRTAKRIILHIRLYFPRLARMHQMLFHQQRQLNGLIFQLHGDTPPDFKAVMIACGLISHFLRLLEGEIIANRDYLLHDHLFPKRYRPATEEEIAAVPPRPEGPVMSPRHRPQRREPKGGPAR